MDTPRDKVFPDNTYSPNPAQPEPLEVTELDVLLTGRFGRSRTPRKSLRKASPRAREDQAPEVPPLHHGAKATRKRNAIDKRQRNQRSRSALRHWVAVEMEAIAADDWDSLPDLPDSPWTNVAEEESTSAEETTPVAAAAAAEPGPAAAAAAPPPAVHVPCPFDCLCDQCAMWADDDNESYGCSCFHCMGYDDFQYYGEYWWQPQTDYEYQLNKRQDVPYDHHHGGSTNSRRGRQTAILRARDGHVTYTGRKNKKSRMQEKKPRTSLRRRAGADAAEALSWEFGTRLVDKPRSTRKRRRRSARKEVPEEEAPVPEPRPNAGPEPPTRMGLLDLDEFPCLPRTRFLGRLWSRCEWSVQGEAAWPALAVGFGRGVGHKR